MVTTLPAPPCAEAGHDAIVHGALRRLHDSAYLELRGVECSWRDGALTLSGRVSRYYYKQLAQVLAAQGQAVPLSNQIRVGSASLKMAESA